MPEILPGLEESKEIEQPSGQDLNTVIVLPDGRIAVQKPRSAADFFAYQSKIQKLGQEAADEWLYLISYQINGVDLTLEDLDSLNFDDRAYIDASATNVSDDIVVNDDKTVEQSDDFTLPDGRRVTRKKLPGNKYAQFKSQLARDQSQAFKWVVKQMFLLDGQPVTDEIITLYPPTGLGFDAAALLTSRVAQLFLTPQVRSKSAGFAKQITGA